MGCDRRELVQRGVRALELPVLLRQTPFGEAASGDALVDSLILRIFAVSAGINVSVAGASVEAIGNLLLSKAAAGHRGLGTDRP